MISAKKLIKMARKWQRMAALSRKRLPLPRACQNSSRFVADKGHFVIYTTDQRRFMVPLEYLYSNLIQELFKMSEDEFGLSSSGPIAVPCDAASIEYIISLIKRGIAKDLEKALLNCVESTQFSRCPLQIQHVLVDKFFV